LWPGGWGGIETIGGGLRRTRSVTNMASFLKVFGKEQKSPGGAVDTCLRRGDILRGLGGV